jgi:hypothetical protein
MRCSPAFDFSAFEDREICLFSIVLRGTSSSSYYTGLGFVSFGAVVVVILSFSFQRWDIAGGCVFLWMGAGMGWIDSFICCNDRHTQREREKRR